MKILFTVLLVQITLFPQSRIHFNDKDIFLSGSNVAWVNFARDIGPDFTDFTQFESIFSTLNENGGNAMRLWLHTNGVSSPQFNSSGKVTGPGSSTISDLKRILDAAWQNDVGLTLCLWSFDMQRKSFGETVTTRANKMLTDTSYTNAYINKCLIPMVTELKDHPAIIAWEIFNEPEGMSNEFGWDFNYHVPMSDIQRFINLCAGAIHRADPDAKVTNGCWSFLAGTDITTGLAKSSSESLRMLTRGEKDLLARAFNQKYASEYSSDEIIDQLEKIYSVNGMNTNYYRDDRLINAGGDQQGILDFYTVHYYDWAGTALSPFSHPYSYWMLDKPLVIAEFYPNMNIRMFEKLYTTGYAGALTWSWTDDQSGATKARTKTEMNYMVQNYPEDIHIEHGSWVVKPTIYLLRQNYPNPFNSNTNIQYWIPENTSVKLEVYDMLGKRVAVLVDEQQVAARHTVIFNGSYLASGIYLCRLKTDKFDQAIGMLLMK